MNSIASPNRKLQLALECASVAWSVIVAVADVAVINLAATGAATLYAARHLDGVAPADVVDGLRIAPQAMIKVAPALILVVIGLRMASGNRPTPFRLPPRWTDALAASRPARAMEGLIRRIASMGRK